MAWLSGTIASIPKAQANILCTKIERLNSVAEGQIKQKIEEHLAARYGISVGGIFELTEQYFITRPTKLTP